MPVGIVLINVRSGTHFKYDVHTVMNVVLDSVHMVFVMESQQFCDCCFHRASALGVQQC